MIYAGANGGDAARNETANGSRLCMAALLR